MDVDRLVKRKRRAKREGNLQQLGTIVKELGDLYFETGKPEDALQEYLEQLEICNALNDKLNSAVAHRMIGEVYANLQDYEKALSHQNQYLEGAKEEKNLLEEQRAFATLGRTYFCLAESLTDESEEHKEALANAKKAYSKSIRLCNELENTDIQLKELMTMRARLLLNLGLVLEARKDHQQAIDLIKNAAVLCEDHNLREDFHRTQIALAGIYERHADYELALEHYEAALQIDDVSLKAEARLSMAELLLRTEKWHESRKILVSLYVSSGLPENLKSQVEKFLRIVATLQRGERALEEEENTAERLRLYENLGDASAAARCFEKAIHYYTEMLSCAEEIKSERTGAALISLAQTLKDTGRYIEALTFARKEFKLCVDQREICRSALFLVDLLITTQAADDQIRETFDVAINNARESSDNSLQLSVLTEYSNYLRKSGKPEEVEKLETELENLREIVSSDNESEESEDIGAEIRLEDLSDVEQELRAKENIRRRPKRSGIVIKRNEKGETQLHVACISGNVENVEKLLKSGHTTNVRDHCGWTPLHEAANHGHVEIVKLLLEYGANVNDPGGSLCHGITPLHDAASCGNISTMRVLMEHGANLMLKTKTGDTVLDCLDEWRNRAGDDISDHEEYEEIRRKLTSILPERVTKKRSALEESDSESENEGQNTQKDIERISAGEDYKRTIASLKHRNNSIGRTMTRGQTERQLGPLLDSEQVLVDDWLEDDIGTNTDKRTAVSTPGTAKRKSNGDRRIGRSVTRGQNERRSGSLLDSEEDFVDDWPEDDIGTKTDKTTTIVASGTAKRKSNDGCKDIENIRKRQKTADISMERDESVYTSESSRDSDVVDVRTSSNEHVARKKQVSLLSIGFTRDSLTPSPIFSSNYYNANEVKTVETFNACLNISVEDKRLKTEIEFSSESQDLLQRILDNIEKKFHDETGCRVKLGLKTNTGTSVSSENLYQLLRSMETEVNLKGELLEIEVPSIVERYGTICKTFNVDIRELVLKSLRSCENTSIFRLKQDEITKEELSCVLKCLEYQKNIQVLNLSGGELHDFGKLLNSCTAKLFTLQELHLQACDINYECLKKLEKFPTQLKSLDLSYNPLGTKSQGILEKLLTPLTCLQSLNLRYCQLEDFQFSPRNGNLVNLDISWNNLSVHGARFFLQWQLLNLNLSNTLSSNRSSFLNDFTSNSRFPLANLESLELAFCDLTDDDVKEILSLATNLTKFVLSSNKRLTVISSATLLKYNPTLRYIDVSGCRTIATSPEPELTIVNPERCTFVTSMLPDVCESWLELWRGKGIVNKLPQNLAVFKPIQQIGA